jgi:hypothetical protein
MSEPDDFARAKAARVAEVTIRTAESVIGLIAGRPYDDLTLELCALAADAEAEIRGIRMEAPPDDGPTQAVPVGIRIVRKE